MKIGIFTDTYLPEINGVVSVVRLMERELRREGHEVTVFAPTHPEQGSVAAEAYRFPSWNFIFYKGRRVALPYNRRALRAISGLEIIHSHDPFSLGLLALWASKRYSIPHVHTYHTFYAEYRRYLPWPIRPSRRMTEEMSRAFCNRCDAVIAPSEQMAEELRKYGITRPIFALPFGVDEEEFARQPAWDVRAALGLPDQDLLLYVGRLGMEKNLWFLLRAYKRLLQDRPQARLIIAGDGPYRHELEGYAAELGLRESVIFTGYLPRERLIDLYKQATLFVFASKTETQGLVLVEAMMAGLPPVAVGAMGVLDVVTPSETGLLVGEDEEEFARACLSLLEDERERERLGEAGRRWAAARSARASTQRLLSIYRQVSGERIGQQSG
ncbi:MAG: glycosyltransferase family 4 protein [Candidatus Acetothermia bacterium]|jgi:glycosyltransferase involved in cell wall biosynthesis|nr:glycosyltransferase family 4 protein [Candidatus Acetothermia bacterium]MDH7504774.1 glycosyltransferase family 4 protein [Candidatus Acetothermia bacterium]